jgi:photosystem II stability/assembly factor-like uncharacterized protein
MTAFTICLGTTGSGLWVSHDSGKSWQLASNDDPSFPYELDVRALAVSKHDPTVIWAAIEGGRGEDVIARSSDAGSNFCRVASPVKGRQVHSIATSPLRDGEVIVGLRPAGALRTTDGGLSWEELPVGASPSCSIGDTRATGIAFTDQPGEVWIGVEIDGLFHTTDDGLTWRRLEVRGGRELLGEGEIWKDERHADIHGVVHSQMPDGKGAVSVATPIGFFRSEDGGESWFATRYPPNAGFDPSVFYTRSLIAKSDCPSTVFVGLGRRPPDHGTLGGLERSLDGGTTWRPVSGHLRSVVWAIADHADIPDVMVAVALNGQVLLSIDGGKSWPLLQREFGETRAVAVTPAIS